ncbi:hypothetical protein AKJ16_DCAP09145 [Drosera capensis]
MTVATSDEIGVRSVSGLRGSGDVVGHVAGVEAAMAQIKADVADISVRQGTQVASRKVVAGAADLSYVDLFFFLPDNQNQLLVRIELMMPGVRPTTS